MGYFHSTASRLLYFYSCITASLVVTVSSRSHFYYFTASLHSPLLFGYIYIYRTNLRHLYYYCLSLSSHFKRPNRGCCLWFHSSTVTPSFLFGHAFII